MPDVHDIRDYGAVIGGATVNDTAIHQAVAAMAPGEKLLIPPGKCRVQNVVLNVPDNCTIDCQGTLVTAVGVPGVAVQIGQESGNRSRLSVQGLKVLSDARDWTPGHVGVHVVNVYESTLDVRQVYGFSTNLLLRGSFGFGSVYNAIHLGQLRDGQVQMRVAADNAGWCNENTCYGGRVDYTSSVTDPTGCVGLVVDHNPEHVINNNRFFATSFEGRAWGVIPAAQIAGSFNSILFPRLEAIGPVVFGADSRWCVFMFGYGGSVQDYVQDLGRYNKVISNGLLRWAASIGVDQPMIQLQSNSSDHAHLLSALDMMGAERAWIKGNGVIWSDQYVYAKAGLRFLTGDGTFRDRGIFAGTGSPEGVVSAAPGSCYSNEAGGVGQTFWVKRSGTGAFGWYAVA